MKVLLLICFSLNLAFGADQIPAEKPNNIATDSRSSEQKNLQSEGNRENVKYQINMSILGTEYSTSAVGASFGYHIDPNDMFLIRYSNYNGSNSTKNLRALTLGYRRFEGNSFNIMPSLYYRENTTTYLSETSPFWYETKDYLSHEIGIGFRIGNEWQWEHFMMGVDWIGINRSVKKFNKTQAIGLTGSISAETYTFTTLNMYFGYSF